MLPIPIVYEEPHFLLVNKPAALFSQAPAGIDSLQARLIAQLKQRDQHPGEPFIGLPHRLDRGTSGMMLIARNQRALKRFGQQFQSRKVIKHYLAVVEGGLVSTAAVGALVNDEVSSQDQRRSVEPLWEARWEDYLRKIPGLPQAEIVGSDAEGAKLAVARVECLQSVFESSVFGDGVSGNNVSRQGVTSQSLLRIQLETGRMHQIRIQAASRGLPVVGDASYGAKLPWSHSLVPYQPSASAPTHAAATTTAAAEDGNAEDEVVEDAAVDGFKEDGFKEDAAHGHPPIALHAWSLEFRHPQTAKSLRFVASVPANWQQLPSELMACIAELA